MTLTLKNITYSLRGRELYSSLSLHLEKSNVLALRGANGSGKSLLMRMIAGLAMPQSGCILWNGEAIRQHQHNLFYLGHALPLSDSLSLVEDVRLRLSLLGGYKDAMSVLSMLKMEEMAHRPCHTLSHGWKQRAALSVIAGIKRPLWLLDEPFTGLDEHAREGFVSVCRKHVANGGNLVIATHHDMKIPHQRSLLLHHKRESP